MIRDRYSMLAVSAVILMMNGQAAFADDLTSTGEVFVDVGEAGGVITLDGVVTEYVTPFLIPDVPVGNHQIEVSTLCGHASSEVQVREGRVSRADMELVLGLGEIRLSSMPGNAQVTLDGDLVGNTPIILREVTCGEHEVLVSAEGYIESSEFIEVGGVGTTRHHVLLSPLTYGDLVVRVSPIDSEVWVDDAYVATGPVTVDSLLSGDHSYSIKREGYITEDGQVEISAESVANIDSTLLAIGSEPETSEGPEVSEEEAVTGDYEGEVADFEPSDSSTDVVTDEAEELVVSQVLSDEDPSDNVEPLESDTLADSSFGVAIEAESGSSRSMGRVVLNSTITAAGLGLGAMGGLQFIEANKAYEQYLEAEQDSVAEDIYDKQVAPARKSAIIFGSLGGATLGAAIWLWLDTDYSVAVSDHSVSVFWRW